MLWWGRSGGDAGLTPLIASCPLGSCETTEGGTWQKQADRRDSTAATAALEICEINLGNHNQL